MSSVLIKLPFRLSLVFTLVSVKLSRSSKACLLIRFLLAGVMSFVTWNKAYSLSQSYIHWESLPLDEQEQNSIEIHTACIVQISSMWIPNSVQSQPTRRLIVIQFRWSLYRRRGLLGFKPSIYAWDGELPCRGFPQRLQPFPYEWLVYFKTSWCRLPATAGHCFMWMEVTSCRLVYKYTMPHWLARHTKYVLDRHTEDALSHLPWAALDFREWIRISNTYFL